MGSPSKRPRIFSDDDDDEGNEQQTVSDPFAKVHATTRGAAPDQSRSSQPRALLLESPAQGRSNGESGIAASCGFLPLPPWSSLRCGQDSRLTDSYYTLKEDSETVSDTFAYLFRAQSLISTGKGIEG
jgi:hypothetical protein